VKLKPFIDYMPQDYPAFATCSRPEISLGGLDAAADLGEIFVEQDQVLTDLKIKAEASDVVMKVHTDEIERLKKQVETTETTPSSTAKLTPWVRPLCSLVFYLCPPS
jgi:hypothetical protein